MCELTAQHGMGTAWARHGHGTLYVNRPLISPAMCCTDLFTLMFMQLLSVGSSHVALRLRLMFSYFSRESAQIQREVFLFEFSLSSALFLSLLIPSAYHSTADILRVNTVNCLPLLSL